MPSTRFAIRESRNDKILYTISGILLLLFTLTILYPLIFIVSCSFSSAVAVSTGKVLLWPVSPSLDGYLAIFRYQRVLVGYINTIFYTLVGTIINVGLTLITAYPLAMPRFQFKRGYLLLFTFTMFFSGGMVPNYLLVSKLGLMNTRLAMLIPGAMSVYNMIVTRTFIQNSIPNELLEASQIDGCSWLSYFFRIILPLSKAVIAVITLYYAVGHWNAYFNALLYLNDRELQPLQLVLREILITRIMPTGETSKGKTLYLPEVYVDSPHINDYPHPKWIELKVSEAKESDKLNKNKCYTKMRQAAQAEYAKGCDQPAVTLTVDFINLYDTEEYKDYGFLHNIFLGDSVRVISKRLGLSVSMRMTQYTYDCLKRQYTDMTLGTVADTLADNTITARQLPTGIISGSKLAINSVGTGALQDGAVKSANIDVAAIETAHIQEAAIATAHIADLAVTSAKIADEAVTNDFPRRIVGYDAPLPWNR